jgi:hypothetical protein
MSSYALPEDIRRALSEALGDPVEAVGPPSSAPRRTPVGASGSPWGRSIALRGGGRLFSAYYKPGASADLVGGAIRQACDGLAGPCRRGGDVVPLVVVPFMGETGKTLCRHAGVSWLDLSGNADIRAPGLRIRLEGGPNLHKRRGRHTDLFSPGSSRVAHALLLHPGLQYTQSELAGETGLSPGTVSLVVRRYAEAGFANRVREGRATRIRLADGDLLLDAWRDAYRFSKHEVRGGHVVARTGEELLQRLAAGLSRHGVAYAATGLAAAWVIEPFAMFRLVSLYVPGWPSDDVLASLGWREAIEGGNVWLLRPVDEVVFMGTQTHRGIQHASAVQTYLDLHSHPERSEEAADRLRRNHLEWERSDGRELNA